MWRANTFRKDFDAGEDWRPKKRAAEGEVDR